MATRRRAARSLGAPGGGGVSRAILDREPLTAQPAARHARRPWTLCTSADAAALRASWASARHLPGPRQGRPSPGLGGLRRRDADTSACCRPACSRSSGLPSWARRPARAEWSRSVAWEPCVKLVRHSPSRRGHVAASRGPGGAWSSSCQCLRPPGPGTCSSPSGPRTRLARLGHVLGQPLLALLEGAGGPRSSWAPAWPSYPCALAHVSYRHLGRRVLLRAPRRRSGACGFASRAARAPGKSLRIASSASSAEPWLCSASTAARSSSTSLLLSAALSVAQVGAAAAASSRAAAASAAAAGKLAQRVEPPAAHRRSAPNWSRTAAIAGHPPPRLPHLNPRAYLLAQSLALAADLLDALQRGQLPRAASPCCSRSRSTRSSALELGAARATASSRSGYQALQLGPCGLGGLELALEPGPLLGDRCGRSGCALRRRRAQRRGAARRRPIASARARSAASTSGAARGGRPRPARRPRRARRGGGLAARRCSAARCG